MRYVLAAFILVASSIPAIAGQGTTTICDYRKDPNAPVCSKAYVPDEVPDRVPGGGSECALTGTASGPDGCVVLMNGETAPKPPGGETVVEKAAQ